MDHLTEGKERRQFFSPLNSFYLVSRVLLCNGFFHLFSISIFPLVNLSNYSPSLSFHNDKTCTVISKTIWFIVFNYVLTNKIRSCKQLFSTLSGQWRNSVIKIFWNMHPTWSDFLMVFHHTVCISRMLPK